MEKSVKKFLPQRLWDPVEFSTVLCGKKTVAAQGFWPVFHISFLYPYFYCISYLLINI